MFLKVLCSYFILNIYSTNGQANPFFKQLNKNLHKQNAQFQGQIGSFIMNTQQQLSNQLSNMPGFMPNSQIPNFGQFANFGQIPNNFGNNGNHNNGQSGPGNNHGKPFGNNHGNPFGNNHGNPFGNNGNLFGNKPFGNNNVFPFGNNNGNIFGNIPGNFGQNHGNHFGQIPNIQIPNTGKPGFGFNNFGNFDFVFPNIFFGLDKTTKKPSIVTNTEGTATAEPNKVTKPNQVTKPNTVTEVNEVTKPSGDTDAEPSKVSSVTEPSKVSLVTEPSKVTSITEPVTKPNVELDLDDYFDIFEPITPEPDINDEDKIHSYIEGLPVILLRDWDIRK